MFVTLLALGPVLGVPGQAPAAEPVHRTLSTDVTAAPAALGRVVDARLPWRANMVGVSFPAARGTGEIEVELRASDGRAWTPWTHLDVDGEDAPDGAERLNAKSFPITDPVWVGETRHVQIRVEATKGMRLGALKVHAINTAGDAYDVSLPLRALRAIGRFLTMQPQEAQAGTSTPAIIPRSKWGGSALTVKPKGFAGYASELKMVFIHHTDNSNSYTKSKSAALVRGVHRYHTSNRGYSDIAYNFLVDRYGQIFEGRWGGTTKPVIGAHTLGFNRYTTGIALLGTYSSFTPPRATQTALKRLLAWKMDVHHIPVTGKVTLVSSGNERYKKGQSATFNRISGHRNAKPTACPGNRTYSLLPSFRTGANALGHPKILLPRIWTKSGTNTLRPDGDGVDEAVRFIATFTRKVDWTLNIVGPSTRTLTGSGSSMSFLWDPRNPSLPDTGRYRFQLDAKIPGGASARPWVGWLYIVVDHPGGTLLSDDEGPYVLGSAATRQDASSVAAKTHFGTDQGVATGPRERSTYPLSTPLALRDGALLQRGNGERFIMSGGSLRRFDEEAFSLLGYRTSALIPADDVTIATQPAGAPVSEGESRHPDGTVILDTLAKETWLINGGVLHPIEPLVLASRYRAVDVVNAIPGDLALPRVLTPVELREGTILKAPDNFSHIYTGGLLRKFIDNTLFIRMGYDLKKRLSATQDQIDALPAGTVLG